MCPWTGGIVSVAKIHIFFLAHYESMGHRRGEIENVGCGVVLEPPGPGICYRSKNRSEYGRVVESAEKTPKKAGLLML